MTAAGSAWRTAPFGSVFKVRYGRPSPKETRSVDGPVPVIGSAGEMARTATALVSEPCLVIGRKGNVGQTHLAMCGAWPTDTTYYVTMIPDIEPKFLDYQLIALDLRRLDSSTATPSLRRQDLESVEIVLPELDEQRRVVEMLEDHFSRLDAAADYASSASVRLGGLRRAALSSIFGTAERRVPFADYVLRIEAGKSLGGAAAPAISGEWGIIKVSAMTWGNFREGENKAIPADRVNPKYEIRPGDLLVSRANTSEYVGASVLVGEDVRPRLLLSDKSLRVLPRPGVDSTWLWRTLQSPAARFQISALATGTKDSMRNISQKSLLQVQLPAVDLPTQREAVSRYSEIEANVRALEAELARVQTRGGSLRRAVLAAAFSGKLTGRRTDQEVIEELADVQRRQSETKASA